MFVFYEIKYFIICTKILRVFNISFFIFVLSPTEDTGTWSDYLVNREYKKNEGPFGEKTALKSRSSCRVNGRSCGCMGTVDSRRNFAQS